MTYATLDWAKAAEIIRESGARNADAGFLGIGGYETPILRDGVPTEPMNQVLVPLQDRLPAVRIGGLWIACYVASKDTDDLVLRTGDGYYAFWKLRF